MKTIIAESLEKGTSYNQYRQAIGLFLEGVKAAGTTHDEIAHYTLLNETRMNRIEKTFEPSPENLEILQHLKQRYTWLVISEGWCGDAAQILPILHALSDAAPNIDMKVVFRDQNDALMDLFLTNGSRSIPKLIILDQDRKVLADWGPRPKGAVDLVANYKLQHGVFDEQAKTDLQLWYLHDKGQSTQNEIVSIMKDLEQRPTQSR